MKRLRAIFFSDSYQLPIQWLPIRHKKKDTGNPVSFFYAFCFDYSASATTSLTSGIILFIIPSIPAFKVTIEEGQPLQLP